jgi:protein-L-isoaspartate(D-aspartate) O-methyltransferase
MTILGDASDLAERMQRYADGLVERGAISTEPVRRAFATVPRHRFLPTFFYGAEQLRLPLGGETPPARLLDLIYANNSLLTHKGQDGDPSSSSSAPTLMARMLEALQLRPGMRVMEIGAGTGYNAALITEITGAPVTTIEAGTLAAANATAALAELGLSERVQVAHRDGYCGDPSGRYDKIIVTCGIAGIPPAWLDQLTAGGMILAPIAHAGAHPVLDVRAGGDIPTGRCVLWADFMTAAGNLRPTELFHHQPHIPIPAAGVRREESALPTLDDTHYNDRTFFLGIHDPRTTRAYLDLDDFDARHGATALVEDQSAVWAQTNGDIVAAGDPGTTRRLRTRLIELSTAWEAAGRPAAAGWECRVEATEASPEQLLMPRNWQR